MPSIDPDALVIGKPDVYYRAVDVLTDWTHVGAVLGDVSFSIDQTWADQPDLGQRGPIIGTHYMANRVARVSFTLAEIAGDAMSFALPGSTATTSVTTATSGGWSTTLATAATAGNTILFVTAVTSMAAGQYVKIGAGSTIEYRTITRVGTAGAQGVGTGITVFPPLRNAQANGAAILQTDGDGSTVIQATNTRRIPTSAYKDWVLVVQSPDLSATSYSGWFEFHFDNAIAVAASAAMTMGSNSWAGLPVTLEATFSEADQTTEPWWIKAPVAS
jgi:hypothetical protein